MQVPSVEVATSRGVLMVQPRYPKPSVRCKSRKRAYLDEKHARQTIIRLNKESRNKGIALRHYYCRFCSHYHITKKETYETLLERSFNSEELSP